MKAPDRIYIQTNAGEALSSKWTTIPFRDFENTEYIKKDALIEWAKANLQDRDNWNENSAADAFWELIDKLNEM